MKRDYAKGRVKVEYFKMMKSKCLFVRANGADCLITPVSNRPLGFPGNNLGFIGEMVNEACALAAADATKRERKRAARIVLGYPCQLDMEKHVAEHRVHLAKKILGTPKGAKP